MNQDSITVSIVIPTFNRKKFLEKALKALLRQNYPHDKYEVVVIDDYSTDGTKELVESIARDSDVKIFYYANNKAKGQTIARNIGFQKAKGEFVASTDDDMKVSEDWIVKGLSYFRYSDISAVEGRTVSKNTKRGPFYHNMSMEGGTYGTGNIFYRKTILQDTGGLDENLNHWHNYGSHYELGLRILERGRKIIYGSDIVAHHPSFKMGSLTIIRNSLKSGAIPYLYKKHGTKIIPYLGFRFYRILVSFLLFSFIVSVIFLNYLAMLISFISVVSIFAMLVSGFTKSGIKIQLKTILVYGISCFFATLVLLYSCARHKVFPSIKMLRM